MPFSCVRRGLAAVALASLAACLTDGTRPNEQRSSVIIRADTTTIGELVFLLKPGEFDTASTTTGTRVFYRNTTTLRIENLAMTLQPASQSTNPFCVTLNRPVVDVVLGAVGPGEERTVLPGLFPAAVTLFIPTATTSAGSLVSPNAGRWQGTFVEYRGTATSTRDVLAVSRSDGALVVYGRSATDRVVASGNVGPAKTLLVYDGTACANNWRGIDSTASVVIGPDSLRFRGRAETASGLPTAPDSFLIQLGRR